MQIECQIDREKQDAKPVDLLRLLLPQGEWGNWRVSKWNCENYVLYIIN